MDFNKNPREPWEKFEAEVTINGAPHIYSFSGKRSSILKNFIIAMKREEIDNESLPGTKWSIDRVGRWDWNIKYLGKEEEESSSSSNLKKEYKKYPEIEKALSVKKDSTSGPLDKDTLVAYLSIATNRKTIEVEEILIELLEQNLIQKDNNNKYIIK